MIAKLTILLYAPINTKTIHTSVDDQKLMFMMEFNFFGKTLHIKMRV